MKKSSDPRRHEGHESANLLIHHVHFFQRNITPFEKAYIGNYYTKQQEVCVWLKDLI